MSNDPYVDSDTGTLVDLLRLYDVTELRTAETDLAFARTELLELRRLPASMTWRTSRRSTGTSSATSTRGPATSGR